MSYFSNFPKLMYSTSLGIKNFKLVPNLIAKVTFLKEILANSDVYYSYSVKDGEKPEDVAYKFYKDPLKHWIILLANEVLDPQYDWVIPSRSLDKHIDKKYSSYTLHLNPTEIYKSSDYTIGEIAYQGSTVDASSSDSTVESFDPINHELVVRSPSDVITNNSTISGATSGGSHTIVGIDCNNDGLVWSQRNIRNYQVTEVTWNDYDGINMKTTKKYAVSSYDYNYALGEVIYGLESRNKSESFLMSDGSTLFIEKNVEPVYYYDYEYEQNEAKRNIVIPKKEYVTKIEEELRRILV